MREEKQAIKEAAAKKIEKSDEVVKAKANVSKPKMLGKIEVPSITKTKTKNRKTEKRTEGNEDRDNQDAWRKIANASGYQIFIGNDG